MVDPEDLDEATRYLDGLPDEEIRRIDRGEIDPDEISFIESLKIEDKVSGGLCRTSRNSQTGRQTIPHPVSCVSSTCSSLLSQA